MSTSKLIEEMRRTSDGPCKPKSATEWLSAAHRNTELREAFAAVYGSKLPTRQKLGQDLSAWAGVLHGEAEYRVVSVYNTHSKSSKYTVETAGDIAAREHAQSLKELKQGVVDDARFVRASNRLAEEILEQEEAKRDEEALAKIHETLKVEVAQAPPPSTEYLTTTRVDQSTGRIIETPVMGRDGQPVRKHKPAPEEAKPAEAERPKTRVEEMRERYLKHHAPGAAVDVARWSNPGGVVTQNIRNESTNDFRTNRLRLKDF